MWGYIIAGLIPGIVLGFIIKVVYNRTPLHDQGLSIVRFNSNVTLETVAQALYECGAPSTRPQFRLNSPGFRRILFSGGRIMSWTSPTIMERLGVDSAHAFVVKDPLAMAKKAAATLRDRGNASDVIENFDPSVKPGAMVMVTIEGERTGVIFRRHVLRLGGPKPLRYRIVMR